VSVINELYERYPRIFQSLVGVSVIGGRKPDILPYDNCQSMIRRPHALGNGLAIETNLSANDIAQRIKEFLRLCGVQENCLRVALRGHSNYTPIQVSPPQLQPMHEQASIASLEEYIKSVGLSGATASEAIEATNSTTPISVVNKALDNSRNIIAMPKSKFAHVDCFVDLDEAERELEKILRGHFSQFGGYSNKYLLFGAACQQLPMFINDNDCDDTDSMYAIARFLFKKKALLGTPCKFSSPHIFEKEPDYPASLQGLMIHLARNNGGVLNASEATEFLQNASLPDNSLNTILQVGSSEIFLMCSPDQFLLSEALGIDEAWCMRIHNRLMDLFQKEKVAYVIPRDIKEEWLTTLPTLPNGLGWTLLLLQEVLNKYPTVGFRTIFAELNQKHETLAAAFVPATSPIQTFADIVTLYMEEHYKSQLPMTMAGEALRTLLLNAKMIKGNEMIFSLPRVLNDRNFTWSNENKTVCIRGNK